MRRNKLKSIDMFQDCTNLEILDLSFNEIDHVTDINMAIGNVTKLNLAHNLLESTDGLQKLFALQDLDISHNSITSMREIRRLASLPCLENLRLQGNPITTECNKFRNRVFDAFAQDRDRCVCGGRGVVAVVVMRLEFGRVWS